MSDGTSQKEQRRHANADDSATSSVDWTNVLPHSRIKSMLQENPKVSILPKQTIDLITAASGLFIRDLIGDAWREATDVVDANDIQQAVTGQPKYAFLSSALEAYHAQQAQASSSHLLGNRKRTRSRAAVTATKKSKGNVEKVKQLSAADSVLAKEAQAVLGADGGTLNVSPGGIEVDEEEYD